MRQIAVCEKCRVEIAYEVALVRVEELCCPECKGLVVVGQLMKVGRWGT